MNEVKDTRNVRRLTGRVEAIQGYTVMISIGFLLLSWFASSFTGFKLIYIIPILPILVVLNIKPRLIAVRYYRREMLEEAKNAMDAEDRRLRTAEQLTGLSKDDMLKKQGQYDQWIRSADRKWL